MDAAFSQFRIDAIRNMDSFAHHENEEILQEEQESNPCFLEREGNSAVDFSKTCYSPLIRQRKMLMQIEQV